MSKAVEVGKEYIEAINCKDIDRLLTCFCEDGILYHPFGIFEGLEKIAEFYTELVFHADTEVTLTSAFGDDRMSAVELVGVSPQAPDDPQYACDIFSLDDSGKITSLNIYYRNTAGA